MKKACAIFLSLILMLFLLPLCLAEGGYTVWCADENGNPVAGAKIQFCDDQSCTVQTTDAEGKAVFASAAPGVWEVHVLKVPEGYSLPEESVNTTADSNELHLSILTATSEAAQTATADTEVLRYQSLDEINFSDYKLVMLNYFAPWCNPCLKEIPDLCQLYEEYKDQGLLIVGMYCDGSEEELDALREEVGLNYPVVFCTEADMDFLSVFPTTLFYDSNRNDLPPTEAELKMLAEESNQSFQTDEEIYAGYIAYYTKVAEIYDPADYPNASAEELEAFAQYVHYLKEEGGIEEKAQAATKQDLDARYSFFTSRHSYEIWKALIEARLQQ